MPIYVYECEKCEKTKEVIGRIGMPNYDKPLECTCGGTMRRTVAGHAKTPKKWTV